ncbi:MAG: DUF423 domain-containing protein [Burkholderiaceae bacterium]|nr:DUF423 domain-containing protein [Burkholderiaceae bacterium]
MMDRVFFVAGALLAGLAVAFGAFGAHALRAVLSPASLATFDTAVRYQMFHALALLAVSWAVSRWPSRAIVWSGWLMIAGVVLFCASLYLLALTGSRALVLATPMGGVAWLAAWCCLAVGAIRR